MPTTCPVSSVAASAKPEQIQKFTRASADVFKKHAREEKIQVAEIIKLLEELFDEMDCGYCSGADGSDQTSCVNHGGHWCPCTIKLSVQSK